MCLTGQYPHPDIYIVAILLVCLFRFKVEVFIIGDQKSVKGNGFVE